MTCTNKDLQALLPAYLERSLDQASQAGIERHIADCEDCRTELALLRMMSEEPVPDPGEAFWAALPGRIYRDVQKHKERDRSPWLLNVMTAFAGPRRAWATAAIVIVALASWLLIRPETVDLARTLPENGTTIEDMTPGDPVNVSELSPTELDAATQWAQNALAPIREAVGEETTGNTDRDITEDLSDLSPRELERVYEMIKKKEDDALGRMRRKAKEGKGLV